MGYIKLCTKGVSWDTCVVRDPFSFDVDWIHTEEIEFNAGSLLLLRRQSNQILIGVRGLGGGGVEKTERRLLPLQGLSSLGGNGGWKRNKRERIRRGPYSSLLIAMFLMLIHLNSNYHPPDGKWAINQSLIIHPITTKIKFENTKMKCILHISCSFWNELLFGWNQRVFEPVFKTSTKFFWGLIDCRSSKFNHKAYAFNPLTTLPL